MKIGNVIYVLKDMFRHVCNNCPFPTRWISEDCNDCNDCMYHQVMDITIGILNNLDGVKKMNDLKPIAYCYKCGRALYLDGELCSALGETLCPDCYDMLCQEAYETDAANGLYDE